MTYASHGLHVVDTHGITNKGEQTHPVNPNGCKVPRGPGWQTRATTGLDEIESFWTGDGKYPPNRQNKDFQYSRVSRSSAFILSPTSVGTPARLPLSTSAFSTHSFSECAEQPIFAEIDMIACARKVITVLNAMTRAGTPYREIPT